MAQDQFFASGRATATPMAQRDPRAFRSGIGEGMAQVGEALAGAAADERATDERIAASEARIAEYERRREQSRKSSAALEALAVARANIRDKRAEMRTANKLDTHQQAFGEFVESEFGRVRDLLSDDPELLERFVPAIVESSLDAKADEADWLRAEAAKIEGEGVRKAQELAGNELMSTPIAKIPTILQQRIDEQVAAIDGMDLPESSKIVLRDKVKRELVQASLDGALMQGGAAAAKGWLDSGALDAILPPDDKKRYAAQIANAEAVEARQAELAEAQGRDAARDAIKAIEAKMDAGIAPTPAELRAAEDQARAAGLDEAELIKFGAMRVGAEVNRRYGALVGQPGGADRLRSARDALAAKVAAGKASEAEQVMVKQLDRLTDAADTREAAALKDLASKGPEGQIAALDRLGGNAAARYARAEKLGEGLGFVANLPAAARRFALQGRDTRKARPQAFGKPVDVRNAFRAQVGALAGDLGGQYDDLLNTAWDIMAGRLASEGREGFDAGIFQRAIQAATGGTTRPGTTVLQGGLQRVRGKPVLLPAWLTNGEFDALLSRDGFGMAVYADGKPANKADVLANYRPQWVGDDAEGRALYQFMDGSGRALMGKSGQPYTMRFADASRGR